MSELASYAKQADDKELESYAKKIRVRAMRRCGELLSELDGRGGDHKSENFKTAATDGFDLTQRTAAGKAGMSERQQLQAVRIANVPDELFDSLVESEAPPTATELAELGKKNYQPLKNEKAFAPAMHFRGTLEDLYNSHMEKQEPQYYLDGMEDWQKEKAKSVIPKIILWLNDFMQLV